MSMKLLPITIYMLSLASSQSHWSNYNSHSTSMEETIQSLREDLRDEFDSSGSDKPLIAGTVRSVFHDCAGPIEPGDGGYGPSICNGCINLDYSHNNGLEEFIPPLYQIYEDAYSHTMSFADFIAAAGTIAIEYAQELDQDYSDELPLIPYYFGRKDCDESPGGKTEKFLPIPIFGWDDVESWFKDNLGMNAQETIAILGAHTLGLAKKFNLGYGTKKWVKDSYVFNNAYYYDLVNTPWKQKQVNCDLEFGCRFEWHDKEEIYLMFNSDVCIFWDIKADENGLAKCVDNIEDCELEANHIKDITLSYANNNQLWLDDFAKVWEILITTGYSYHDLQKYEVPLSSGGGYNKYNY